MKYLISIAQTVNRTRRLTSVICPMHIHRYMEMVVVTDGVLNMEIGRKHYEIMKGQAVMIEPFEPHSYVYKQKSTCIVIEFTMQMHPTLTDWLKTRGIKNKLFTLSDVCYEYINSQIPLEPSLYNGYNAAKMQSFICPLADAFMSQCEFEISQKKYDDDFIEVLDYITQNLNDSLSLVSVAEKINIRPDSLSRKFAEKCDLSFHEFVQSLRLCEACSHINCGLSIAEAAMRSGFGSICSFNRIFKHFIGVTPTQFKKSGKSQLAYLGNGVEIAADEYDPLVKYVTDDEQPQQN